MHVQKQAPSTFGTWAPDPNATYEGQVRANAMAKEAREKDAEDAEREAEALARKRPGVIRSAIKSYLHDASARKRSLTAHVNIMLDAEGQGYLDKYEAGLVSTGRYPNE